MYSKQEATQLRKEFWTSFGLYMSPIVSAEGEKINWINYKTGEKGIQFKLYADNTHAVVFIELSHNDIEMQQLYFEHFKELKNILNSIAEGEWLWQLHTTDESGKIVSKIFTRIEEVNIFRKKDWPTLISFFKKNIIALDEFWSNVKYSFEALR